MSTDPPSFSSDFREIAHSGGKVIFRIVSDTDGRRGYQVTWTGSRPHAMALFAIYALPQGIPVANLPMGGIGSPWPAPPHPSCIPVMISSDSEGLFGHECSGCGGYWRSRGQPNICCYCRSLGESFQFLTAAQLAYVEHYAKVLRDGLDSVEDGQEKSVEIDMDAIIDGGPDVPKPAFYYPGTSQQTTFKCENCETVNDIRGRFGYCCACGLRNNLAELRSQIERIRANLNEDHVSPEESVKGIISVFDACCRDLMSQLAKIPMRSGRRHELQQLLFHNLDAPTDAIRRAFDIDLLKGLDAELKFLKIMFARRHVFEHGGGVADRIYVEESGDTTVIEGTLVRETRENAHRLAGDLVQIASNFSDGFHEILPVLTA